MISKTILTLQFTKSIKHNIVNFIMIIVLKLPTGLCLSFEITNNVCTLFFLVVLFLFLSTRHLKINNYNNNIKNNINYKKPYN